MERNSSFVNKALESDNDSPDAETESSFKDLLQMADELFMKKKFAEAEDYYEECFQIVEDKQTKGKCCMRLGTTLGKLGRFVEARSRLEEALELINDSPDKDKISGDPEVNEDTALIYHNLAELMYFLCEEEKENRYRTIAKNINQTLQTIEEAARDGIETEHIIRRYVKPNEAKLKDKNEKVYKMTADERGFCLIINNREFKDSGPREGSEIDEANMSNVFKQLKFNVQTEHNLPAKELIDTVSEWVDKPKNTDYDAFVLVIMSHGKEDNRIVGSDGDSIRWHDIMKNVYASKTLDGKPRLIILQACNGGDITKIKDDSQESEVQPDVKVGSSEALNACQKDDLPNETDVNVPLCNRIGVELHTDDCCILNSTIPGFVSLRIPGKGSPFIAALTEALFEHSHTKHIGDIFGEATKLMRAKLVKQRPNMIEFGDERKLYFFP